MRMVIWIILIVLSSCCKEEPLPEPIPDPPKEESAITLEWLTRIDTTKEVVGAWVGAIYNDWYFVSNDLEDQMGFKVYDVTSGELIKHITGFSNRKERIDDFYVYKDVLICKETKNIFAFNLPDLSLKWELNFFDTNWHVSSDLTITNNSIFFDADYNLHGSGGKEMMVKVDLEDGSYDILYEYDGADQGGITGTLGPPVIFSSPHSGRDIAIFNKGYVKSDYFNYGQHLVALDLDSKKIVWENDVFTDLWSNGVHSPVLWNDIVITGGDYSIYGFDALTGDSLWTYSIPDDTFASWLVTHHLVHEDKLYVNSMDFDIACIDPSDGSEIWLNTKDAPNCKVNMIYYDDLLVFTSWGYGSVMVLDALTGELVDKLRAPNESVFYSDPVYSEEHDMFCTVSYKDVVGFTVKNPKKE